MKSVVITGGNRGIGRSITEAFVMDLVILLLLVRAADSIHVEQLAPDQVAFVEMDVRNEADHSKLAQVAIAKTGELNAWVNNAGISAWKPIGEIDETFFDELMGINLKGAFWGCKAAATAMSGNGGAIINISSIAGKRGSANNAMYCATKFGMNGLTQSLVTPKSWARPVSGSMRSVLS